MNKSSRNQQKKDDNRDIRPLVSADRKMLELLVCPITKTSLNYDVRAQELISRATHLAYPIRDGIPILIPSEARLIK